MTISQFDITVGNGKTLDVDVPDVDGAAVLLLIITMVQLLCGGTFSTMTTDSADIKVVTSTEVMVLRANATFINANVTGTLYVDTVDAYWW